MKFNFKKITSVLASAVMLGSTMGFAAAASYPAPFVQGGAANVGIVVGADAANSDYIASIDLGQSLSSELAKQTVSGGTSTGASTSGEGVNLATSSRSIYYGDSINAGRPTLTNTELPTVLADGTFEDLSGTTYTYQQILTVGDTPSVFGTSGGSITDPVMYLNVGSTATDPLYNYTLSLNKNINVSDATNVQGQKINILGVDYIIGAGSTNTTLKLYGSGETLTLSSDTGPTTVPIGGEDHIIELVAATGSSSARISVDGASKTISQGSSSTFGGGVVVYLKEVTYQQYAGGLQEVELIIGANSLTIENGKSVKVGTDNDKIKTTLGTVDAAGHGVISGFTIQVAMVKDDLDHIAGGEEFMDPVFGGLSVQFAGETPAIDAESRGTILVNTDNSRFAYATFKSAKATEEYKFTYGHDNTTDSGVQMLLAGDSTQTDGKGFIHVVEGTNAREGDYIIVDQGDNGVIVQIESIDVDTDETSGEVELIDVITDEVTKKTLNNGTGGFSLSGTTLFGGTSYTIWAAGDATTMNITWDSTTATTVFPRIKLADGGWITFLTETTIANETSILLPNGLITQATTGTSTINSSDGSVVLNGINWSIRDDSGTVTFDGIGASATSSGCNFNATRGPAVLFLEPKKWDDTSTGDYICVPLITEGTETVKLAVATGSTVDLGGTDSGFVTLDSDSDIQQAVDKFGSFVETDSNDNNQVTINYPGSQMFLDVLFTEAGATVTGGSSSGANVATLGSVTKTDQEISSIQDKNLIVIGGSCINSVAAEILEGSFCGSAFTDATGVGPDQFLIKVVESPYDADKIAMLVAGYEAADTTKAVEYVTNDAPITDVDTEKKLITATYAEVA